MKIERRRKNQDFRTNFGPLRSLRNCGAEIRCESAPSSTGDRAPPVRQRTMPAGRAGGGHEPREDELPFKFPYISLCRNNRAIAPFCSPR
jgi:hypothetical protein